MKSPDFFVGMAQSHSAAFSGLLPWLEKAGIKTVLEIYIAKAFFISALAFFPGLVYSLVMTLVILRLPLLPSFLLSLMLAIFISLLAFAVFYLHPRTLASGRRKSIEVNLPFAATHMRALAGSGVPPQKIFEVLAESEEYGELAKELAKVHRNISMLGMDFVSAVRAAAGQSPSDSMRQFLNGLAATTTSGGNLGEYLRIAADNALADYRTRREKWLSTLSIYADLYVGVLIAAPLFFISILSLLAVIGGQVVGLSVPFAMSLGIYIVMPALNTAFLLFIHYTQPAV